MADDDWNAKYLTGRAVLLGGVMAVVLLRLLFMAGPVGLLISGVLILGAVVMSLLGRRDRHREAMHHHRSEDD